MLLQIVFCIHDILNIFFPFEQFADDPLSMNDDASSLSSMNSYKCSNVQYCDNSGNEDENGPTLVDGGSEPLCYTQKANNKKCTTLLCPCDEELEASYTKQLCNPRMHPCNRICGGSSRHDWPRLTMIHSSVDERRSQQLQRLLILEEVYKYKRRMFNTVGAMENIGFQHPERGGGCYTR